MKVLRSKKRPYMKEFFRNFRTCDGYNRPVPFDYDTKKVRHIYARGEQMEKFDPHYSCIWRMPDYDRWNGVSLIAYALIRAGEPDIRVQPIAGYNKIGDMYARFFMEDIVRFGKRWFHGHLNIITRPENLEEALGWNMYIPERNEEIKRQTIPEE